MRTDSADMYLRRQITPQWLFPSKVLLQGYLEVEVQRQKRTS